MNKKGEFVWPRSLLWLGLGVVFLYLALMPFFEVFPYNFELGETLLSSLIVLVGLLIFIESFRRDKRFKRVLHIIIGLVIVVIGIYIFLLEMNISLPYEFSINKIVLQIILILYSIYLIIGAFEQTKKVVVN